jgi:DNA repair exonuclease SbcCD nuclease subunit
MAEFNYAEYLKNNPLLQEEVKDKLLTESQEVSEEAPSSKTTVSALKAQIKEMILASLLEEEPVAEADEDEEVEVDIEDEIEADAEPEMEPAMDAAPEGGAEGLSSDEKEIQDALKLAYDNAISIGDQKLADQIGNSITFFTRTHVVER